MIPRGIACTTFFSQRAVALAGSIQGAVDDGVVLARSAATHPWATAVTVEHGGQGPDQEQDDEAMGPFGRLTGGRAVCFDPAEVGPQCIDFQCEGGMLDGCIRDQRPQGIEFEVLHEGLGRDRKASLCLHPQEKVGQRLNEILSHHTGQSIETIARDTERDNFKSAEASRDYGLVDHVLERRPEDSIQPA